MKYFISFTNIKNNKKKKQSNQSINTLGKSGVGQGATQFSRLQHFIYP